MKLVDSEPTHVQLDAMSAYSDDLSKYRAAMDAAPSVKVDIWPVAIYEADTSHLETLQDSEMAKGWRWHRKDFRRGDKLYSTEDIAALQAENKRLTKQSADRLIGLCKCWEDADALRSDVAKLTAERDELLSVYRELAMSIASGDTIRQVISETIAKHDLAFHNPKQDDYAATRRAIVRAAAEIGKMTGDQ